ncbi:MAG: hypothetical protein JSS83_04340 [Cyanobacteria bacterium SZAS LIN-3]|nr:hypothetical protein [Cyanobacteria bacterium SZAS LIN-3]MBS2008975.1 hypothetical protein [Cyanobacteria bacterium SZAS TMP-1]
MPSLLAGGLLLGAAGAALAQVETTTVKTTTVTTDPLMLPVGTTYVVIDPITGATRGVYDPIVKRADFPLSPGMIVIDSNSNRAVATFDAAGNLVALSSAPVYDPLLSSIDSRRAEFDRVIAELSTRGNYDAATILALREALDRINAQTVAYKSSGRPLTYAEELSLAVQLNDLGDRLMPFSRTVTYTPLVGARFISSEGQIMFIDSYGGRNLQLQRRIDSEYAAGRLSNNQVADLKHDLNEISSMQARYTKGGKIKESKQKLITEKLDKVQTAMERDIASINEKRARIGIKVN